MSAIAEQPCPNWLSIALH